MIAHSRNADWEFWRTRGVLEAGWGAGKGDGVEVMEGVEEVGLDVPSLRCHGPEVLGSGRMLWTGVDGRGEFGGRDKVRVIMAFLVFFLRFLWDFLGA